MAYFPDLTRYSFLPTAETSPALNVGWLDPAHAFSRGATGPDFHSGLFALCQQPVHRTRGIHRCGFCSAPLGTAPMRETLAGDTIFLGSAEVRVIGEGVTYAAPDLIYHYVVRHEYRPPEEFIRAVVAQGAGNS